MINGIHGIVYAKDAEKARAFFRDTLGFRHVDAGEGWLIFALPPAEMGVHPEMVEPGAPQAAEGKHELYLMCDDVASTVVELQAKGVDFLSPVTDQGWGLLTTLRIPGGGVIGMYQPRHPTTFAPAKAAAARPARRAARKAAERKPAKRRAARKAAKRKPAKRKARRGRR
jgi:catechol 2,3-dioxygenase-like lactoylglutathione lyase family enzyme